MRGNSEEVDKQYWTMEKVTRMAGMEFHQLVRLVRMFQERQRTMTITRMRQDSLERKVSRQLVDYQEQIPLVIKGAKMTKSYQLDW